MMRYLNVSIPYGNSVKQNLTHGVEWRVRLAISVLVIGLVGGGGSAQTARGSRIKEQSHFGEEVTIINPVEIPSDVLAILREDKRNQTCLREGELPTNITGSWFVGSKIHLHSDRFADLVVTVQNPCLLGANLVPYWLFQNTGHGYRLVLTTYTLSLNVRSSRTKGFRDVGASAVAGQTITTVTYRFNGMTYTKDP
jgi:hypothetical protein